MGNNRGTADHMEEITKKWETYLGHIKKFRNCGQIHRSTVDRCRPGRKIVCLQYGTYATLTLECDNTL